MARGGRRDQALREGDAVTLSAYLRDARQRAGLGVRQAARLAGCTHAAILHAETGRRVPEDPLLRALATVYGADADELYRLAGRVPADVRELLLAEPGRFAAVRVAWRRGATLPELPEADFVNTEETER